MSKIVLVTGANRGIGFEICSQLTKRDHVVILTARDEEKAKQTILLSYDIKRTGIKVFAMCPGWVKTDMGGTAAPRPVHIGADTAVWLALENEGISGKFYPDRKIIQW